MPRLNRRTCCPIFLMTVIDMSKTKTPKKNSQLIIRINDEERARFVSLCEELDTSAAREVRRFIRSFIKDQEKQSGN